MNKMVEPVAYVFILHLKARDHIRFNFKIP